MPQFEKIINIEAYWREVSDPVDIAKLPFTHLEVEASLKISFDECQQKGLGVYRYCVLKLAGTVCVLESYPQTPGLSSLVTVKVLSYEENWDRVIEALCGALCIPRSHLIWEQSILKPAQWSLYRLDDNANEVLMFRFPDEIRAKTAQAVYEQRGHKQSYLIRKSVN